MLNVIGNIIGRSLLGGDNAPSQQVSNLIVTDISDESMSLSWTKTGSSTIILVSESAIVDSPLDGTTYSVGEVIGDSVVGYVGSAGSADISNLTPETEYFFRAIAHNGSKYNTDTGDNEITEKTFCTEYQAVLDRATTLSYTLPSLYTKKICSQFIIDLKSLNAWDEFDNFYVSILNNTTLRDIAKLNWKTPTTFPLTEIGGGSIDYELRGFDIPPGSSSIFMRMNSWAPTDGVKYTLNDCGIGFWIYKNEGFILGCNEASGLNKLRVRSQSSMTYSLNCNAGGVWAVPGDTTGWHHYRRTASNQMAAYHNGVLVSTSASASEGLCNLSLNIGGINNNGPNNINDGFNFSILYTSASLSGVNMVSMNSVIGQFIEDVSTPDVQSQGLSASNYGENSLTISLAPGSGSERLLVGKKGGPVDSLPVNGISYTANPVFGSGDEIGTGNFVVGKSSGSVFDLELPEYDDYYFRSFEIGVNNTYNKSEAIGNPLHVEFLDLETGLLESLHVGEGYEEIKARRSLNWDKFKTRVDAHKTADTTFTLPNDVVEVFFDGQPITINDTESLSVAGDVNTTVSVYPFAIRDASETLFDLNTGSEIIINKVKFSTPSKRKYEVYPCILKKNGNPKLIEVQGEVRAGFWSNMAVGKRIRYNWEFETDGVNNATIASWDADAKIITLNQNISSSVSDNMSGPWVNVCMLFEESVPLSDYNQYGDFWYDLVGGVTGDPGFSIIAHTKIESGNNTVIDLTDVEMTNLTRAISISSKTCKLNISGNCKISGAAGVALNFFTGEEVGVNELVIDIGAVLTIEDNGSLIKGGHNTADNILGSGGYIAPNVKITSNGDLVASGNLALPWRQFTGSLDQKPINLGDETYYKSITISGGGEGGEIITSNSMPVVIDNIVAPWVRCGGSLHIKGGTIGLINGNSQQQPDAGTPITVQIDDTEVGQINFGYSSSRMPYLTVTLNRVTFKAISPSNNTHVVASTSSLDNLSLNDCQFVLNGAEGVDPYTPGTIPDNSKSSWNILGGARMKNVTISGLLTEAYMAILLGTTINDRVGNELVISVSDSEINTPQIMSTTNQSGARSGMFHLQNSTIHSDLYNRYAGSCYGFKVEPIVNENLTPISILASTSILVCFAGVLEDYRTVNGVLLVDFQSNHVHVNSGTIRLISPWMWGRKPSTNTVGKVNHSNCWEGDLLITAEGGDITFEKFDSSLNPLGNIENDFVLPQGQTAVCTCNRYKIFSSGGGSAKQQTIGTTDGVSKEFSGESDRITIPEDFSITCDTITITFDQDGYGSGTGVEFAYYDFFGGRWFIEFTEIPAVSTPIVRNYKSLGTWLNTGGWTISLQE